MSHGRPGMFSDDRGELNILYSKLISILFIVWLVLVGCVNQEHHVSGDKNVDLRNDQKEDIVVERQEFGEAQQRNNEKVVWFPRPHAYLKNLRTPHILDHVFINPQQGWKLQQSSHDKIENGDMSWQKRKLSKAFIRLIGKKLNDVSNMQRIVSKACRKVGVIHLLACFLFVKMNPPDNMDRHLGRASVIG